MQKANRWKLKTYKQKKRPLNKNWPIKIWLPILPIENNNKLLTKYELTCKLLFLLPPLPVTFFQSKRDIWRPAQATATSCNKTEFQDREAGLWQQAPFSVGTSSIADMPIFFHSLQESLSHFLLTVRTVRLHSRWLARVREYSPAPLSLITTTITNSTWPNLTRQGE